MQENQKCSGGGDAKEEGLLKTRSLLNENKLPLEDMKKRVARNLEKLVAAKIVSKEDNYQAIVNMIARVCFYNIPKKKEYLILPVFCFVL